MSAATFTLGARLHYSGVGIKLRYDESEIMVLAPDRDALRRAFHQFSEAPLDESLVTAAKLIPANIQD